MASLMSELAAASLLFAAIVTWPERPPVRHHRISNYFFMRRVRVAQLRARTPGGPEQTGDVDSPHESRRLNGSGVEPPVTATTVTAPSAPQTLVTATPPPDRRGHRAHRLQWAQVPHSTLRPLDPHTDR